jgi:hypothetical protein
VDDRLDGSLKNKSNTKKTSTTTDNMQTLLRTTPMNSSLLSTVLFMIIGGNLGLFHQSRFFPLLVHGSITPVTCLDEAQPCVYEFQQTNCSDLMFYNDIFGDDNDNACCTLQDTEAGTCTVTTAIGGRCTIVGRPGKSCSAAAAAVTGGVEPPYPCVPGNVVVIESILQSDVSNSSTRLECPASPYGALGRPPSIFDEFPKSTLRLEGVMGTMNESEAYFVLETTKRHILSFYDQSDLVRELIVDVSLYPIMPTMMMMTKPKDNTTTAAAVSYLLLGSYRGVEGAFRLNDPFVGEAVAAPYLAALKTAGGPFFSTLTGITHTIEPAAVRLWTFLELEGLIGLPSSGNGDLTAWTETTKNHILSHYEDSDAVVDLMFEIENLLFDTTADNTTTVSFEIFGSYRGSKTALELNDSFMEDAVGPYVAAVNALDGPFIGTLTGISFDVPAPIATTPAPSNPATPTNAPIMAKPPTAKTVAPVAVPITDKASSTSTPVRAGAELMPVAKPTAKPAAAPVVDSAATTPDDPSSSSTSLPGTIPHLVLLPFGLLLWQQFW